MSASTNMFARSLFTGKHLSVVTHPRRDHLGNSSDNGSTGRIIQYALVALLRALAIRTYRHREHVEPPR